MVDPPALANETSSPAPSSVSNQPEPDTPGTVGTKSTTHIDIISSEILDQSDVHPLAWKEGSLHSTLSSDKLPSWVPFGLRLLAAEQLQYNHDKIDLLYDLRDRSVRTDYWNTSGMEAWTCRIDNTLANTYIRKKKW